MNLGLREFCLAECGVWPEFTRAARSDEPAGSISVRRGVQPEVDVRDGLRAFANCHCGRRRVGSEFSVNR